MSSSCKSDPESLNKSPSRRRLSSMSRHVTFWSAKSEQDLQSQDNEQHKAVDNRPRRYIESRRTHPLSAWKFYCYLVTWCVPPRLMRLCGMKTKERQMAWREKVGLMSVIVYAGVVVTYLTFGLSGSLCNYSQRRVRNTDVSERQIIVHGRAFDYTPVDNTSFLDISSDSLFGPKRYGGKDASFMFQNVNGNCREFITGANKSSIPMDSYMNLAWYFPCEVLPLDITTDDSVLSFSTANCHLDTASRDRFYMLRAYSEVYYTWDEVMKSDFSNDTERLVVFNGDVLDLSLLDWLMHDDLDVAPYIQDLRMADLQGYDISVLMNTNYERRVGKCLAEIIKVGEIDSKTVGCIAADVVLYVALGLILMIIFSKFLVACYFHWAIAKKQGATRLDNKSMQLHSKAIEDWSRDIGTRVPPSSHPALNGTSKKSMASYLEDKVNNLTVRKPLLLNEGQPIDKSGNTRARDKSGEEFTTMGMQEAYYREVTDGTILEQDTLDPSLVFPLTVLQPSPFYKPFDFPLIHTLCLVTCYSEDETGLRTTLDSLATTDYPNSHKLLLVICDGRIKGSGNKMTTPDIVLGMVEDLMVPRDKVKACSYVAVASGAKRHNMAKVYSGFYKYNPETVPDGSRQHVPIVVIVKCGTEEEELSAKPGNRGKRDSQIILMSFLQKITMNERMTELDYNILKGIWSVTGLMADQYEAVLMVDADTKVFPDSLTHMVSELVRSPEIMGLCGETKIANKRESFITAIQVFEYYISHHQIKAFESVFGTVTCLPGCFSIYRIKSPRGASGEWVPILANPDICDMYADNNVVTLHKKNLLLLGEDRYLTSLMLKTFPKRKLIFVPKAACKTVVPASFSVLLSQRRRWINSTVHNLFELVLVPGMCGTFCFSMQFVVIIELIGTLVLPLAICFTLYVICIAIFSPVMPTMTLLLLALILGLPGVLVLAIVSSISYIGWLLVYLLALPLWNLVLPLYAFWKFDDFSWGDTRKVAGDNGKHDHDDDYQNFEHSMIQMMTWRQFKREGY